MAGLRIEGLTVRRLLILAAVLAALLGAGATAAPAMATPAAHAAVSAPAAYGGSWAGDTALDWAEAHAAGCWYSWAGAGPCSRGYDCSGLVMAAFAHAGIALPHSTYAMLSSPRLHRIPVAGAPRGALLFYGSGHVEFNTIWYHTSFGAHSTGQRVGWTTWGWGWQPTMAFIVR